MNLTIDLSPESTKQPIWYNQYSLLGRLGRTSITKKWGTKCDWKCYTILVYCTYLIRKCIYNHKHFRPKAWIFMGGGCPLKIISEKAQCPRPRNLPSIGDYCNKQCEAQALQAQVAVCLMRYLLQTELGRHRLHHHPVAAERSLAQHQIRKHPTGGPCPHSQPLVLGQCNIPLADIPLADNTSSMTIWICIKCPDRKG